MRRHLRWFGAILPISVALLLAFLVTDILYSEGKRNSLAGGSEKILIEFTLSRTLWDAPLDTEVIVVSLSEDDAHRGLVLQDSSGLRDASMSTYGKLTAHIFAQDPEFTLVSWLPAAHGPTELAPLGQVLEAYHGREAFVVAHPIAEIGSLPERLRNLGVVREGEDCVYQVNSFCTVNPTWQKWLVQDLVERFWPHPAPFHISTNLPHVYPNFLLNLPRRATIREMSFSEVLSGDASVLQGKVVVIGNSLAQPAAFADNKELVRRTLTVENRDVEQVGIGGTPLHVFWAQIISMFLNEKTVAIPHLAFTRVVMVALCLTIILMMWKLGPVLTFGIFLGFAALFPLLNIVLIRVASLYVPTFEILYGGSLTFLFATFGQLSVSRYRSWSLEAQRKTFETAADLKSNFISLISHNLNTPIAKLQGLLDVMIQTTTDEALQMQLKASQELVIKQRMLVKSILMSTTVEQQGVSRTRCSLKDLIEEFGESMTGMINRFGVTTNLSKLEGLEVDLYLDKYLVCQALATVTVLLKPDNDKTSVNLSFFAQENADSQPELTVMASCTSTVLSSEVGDLVGRVGVTKHSRDLESLFFYKELMIKFVHLVATHYGGSFSVGHFGAEEGLRLTLRPGFSQRQPEQPASFRQNVHS